MTDNVTKLHQVKANKSQIKHILLYMCQIRLTIFLTHGVPNTSQVKPTEDIYEAYFTQHLTLCQCQIYSVVVALNSLWQSAAQCFALKRATTTSQHCGGRGCFLCSPEDLLLKNP
jgi:hypothetical protein